MPISDQVTVSHAYSIDDQSFTFKVSGRPPSALPGGVQGDHVTAFALLKRGIARHLLKVTITDPTNLKEIRQLRERILDHYISPVLAIDPQQREEFIKTLLGIQDKYNALRTKKSEIRWCEELLDRLPTQHDDTVEESSPNTLPTPDDIEKIRAMIKKIYNHNSFLVCSEIGEMAESFLTQYNKIPDVAYEKMPDLSVSSSEGSEVKESLKYLDGVDTKTLELDNHIKILNQQLEWLKQPESQEYSPENAKQLLQLSTDTVTKGMTISKRLYSQKLQETTEAIEAKLNKKQIEWGNYRENPLVIAQKISRLFFYPKASDAYNDRTRQMQSKSEDIIRRRDNNPEMFYTAMARHLHIIFSAYSELTDPKAKKHAIIEEFVKLNGNRWKLNIEETIKQVTDNLLEIKQDFIHITQTDGYQSRHSSIDEGEVGISPSVEPGTGEQTETKERRLTH